MGSQASTLPGRPLTRQDVKALEARNARLKKWTLSALLFICVVAVAFFGKSWYTNHENDMAKADKAFWSTVDKSLRAQGLVITGQKPDKGLVKVRTLTPGKDGKYHETWAHLYRDANSVYPWKASVDCPLGGELIVVDNDCIVGAYRGPPL